MLRTWQNGQKVIKYIGFDATENDRAEGKGSTYSANPKLNLCPRKGIPSYKDRYDVRYPLIEAGITRSMCRDIIVKAGLPIPPKSACFFCLAGETEVITPDGLRPIASLAGQTVELLVPIRNGHYKTGKHGKREFQSNATWVSCPIKSFGVQALYAVTLKRGAQYVKVIRTTAEHRWFLENGIEVTTAELKSGNVLASARVPSLTCAGDEVQLSPPGVQQGFVFGDGTLQPGNRPAGVLLYGEKYTDLLPWFAANTRVFTNELEYSPERFKSHKGQTGKRKIPAIRDLPQFWKKLPPLRESKSYLLGWLAGYFAADGEMTGGKPVISSSNPENIQFVRSLCQILGIRTGKVGIRDRIGIHGEESQHYRVGLVADDLPDYFFIRKNHRKALRRPKQSSAQLHWKVVAVTATGESEEVYCAQVEGAERFVLADHLVTGNCPASKVQELKRLAIVDPAYYVLALAMEVIYRTGHHFRSDTYFTVKARHKETGEKVSKGYDAKDTASAREMFRVDFDDLSRPYKYELSVSGSVGGLDFGKPWLKVAVELPQAYRDRLRDFMGKRGHPFEIDNRTLPILS